jgi:sigma-54 dependent transcriptional regulator, acetoin dehydrogenase operon transcriptional activator AcoR
MESRLTQWRRFIGGLPVNDPANDALVASWQRSFDVDAEPGSLQASLQLRKVPDAELMQRRARRAELIDIAQPYIHSLLQTTTGSSSVCYLTDEDGIVLFSLGADDHLKMFGLTPGHDRSEKAVGTNGAGTCLMTGRPTAVVGPDHFSDAFHDCTCTAAPIRGADGELIGALDVSSSVADARPDRLRFVALIARSIEQALASKASAPSR